MKNTKVTTVCNLKGGTGKTTTVLALSYGLANRGYKVLAIDFDSQANLSRCFGKHDMNANDIYDWIIDNKDVRVKINDNLDLVPASKKGINGLNDEFRKDIVSPSGHLKNQLEIYDYYDFVIIDVPSLLSYELTNALVASDSVIIPAKPDFLSTDGMEDMSGTVAEFMKINPNLNLTGVFINQVRTNTAAHKNGIEEIDRLLEKNNITRYSSIVRESSLIEVVQKKHVDFYSNIKKNPGAQDFSNVVDEFLEKIGA